MAASNIISVFLRFDQQHSAWTADTEVYLRDLASALADAASNVTDIELCGRHITLPVVVTLLSRLPLLRRIVIEDSTLNTVALVDHLLELNDLAEVTLQIDCETEESFRRGSDAVDLFQRRRPQVKADVKLFEPSEPEEMWKMVL